MKSIIINTFLLLFPLIAFSQNVSDTLYDSRLNSLEDRFGILRDHLVPLDQSVNALRLENTSLRGRISELEMKLGAADSTLIGVQEKTMSNTESIINTQVTLNERIDETVSASENKFSSLTDTLSKNTLYGIIGLLLALLLVGLVFWLLNSRRRKDHVGLTESLNQTKVSIEEKLIGEFNKQTEMMDALIKLIESKSTAPDSKSGELDHSLALKVADEITLIQRNISLMDSTTKGLKQLNRSVSKLKDNLLSKGYEMPELIGLDFHQGMKVIVTSSIPNEDLEKNKEVISKVIKPQVNFNDKMIQTAQIEVSVGY